jgi:hypothetical protein
MALKCPATVLYLSEAHLLPKPSNKQVEIVSYLFFRLKKKLGSKFEIQILNEINSRLKVS